jgi:hypothetical protein
VAGELATGTRFAHASIMRCVLPACRRRSCRRARSRSSPCGTAPGDFRHFLRRDLAFVRAADDARNVAAHLDVRAARGIATGAKRSSDSAIEQLMFFFENASDAAPKIATSVAPAARALRTLQVRRQHR